MAMSPFRSLRSTFAIVVISISAAVMSSGCTPTDGVTIERDDYPSIEPPRSNAEMVRAAYEVADLRAVLPFVPRFPLALTTLPVVAGIPGLVASAGPGRELVTPGRASNERQSVPSRSRRKVRVWERDAV